MSSQHATIWGANEQMTYTARKELMLASPTAHHAIVGALKTHLVHRIWSQALVWAACCVQHSQQAIILVDCIMVTLIRLGSMLCTSPTGSHKSGYKSGTLTFRVVQQGALTEPVILNRLCQRAATPLSQHVTSMHAPWAGTLLM